MTKAVRLFPILLAAAALAAEPKPPPVPPTDAECIQFGTDLAADLTRGDRAAVIRTLDPFAFVDRATAGFDVSEDLLIGLREGMLSRVNETLERSLAAFKVARFLRPEIRGTEKRVLVRCETSTGAVNYLSFACTRRASGALKWIDVYIFMSAEDFSQTLRRIVLPMILESKKGLLENLAAGDHAYFRHLLEFARIAELTQQGKNREALDALHALPAELQTDHYILFMKVRLAQGINNTEYLHAIEEWEKAEPQDPALLMASIDGDVLRKDYHAAIAKATLLDEHLGGDAYQEYLIAGLHHLAAEPAAARLSARHALAQEPGMLRAYDLLIVLALEAGNNADLVDLLQEIEMKFPGTDMAKAVATEPRYSGLRSSAVFAAWLNVRSLPGLPADPATRHP